MCPTIGYGDGLATLARRLGQPIITGVPIDLQDAIKAGQELFCVFATAIRGVEKDDPGRIVATPTPVVAC